jgi:hypothetical protein
MSSLLALIPIAAITVAPEPCFALEPSVSELVGMVEERTFPGPPNYGESPTDSHETQLILVLVAPICVSPPEGEPFNKSWGCITEITLVPIHGSSKAIPRKGRINVVGTLFGAHTAHHHTPVLLSVLSVAEVV